MQRHLEFDGGIAYGIDCMLTDPTLGGRCDTFITGNFTVSPLAQFFFPLSQIMVPPKSAVPFPTTSAQSQLPSMAETWLYIPLCVCLVDSD